MRLRYKVLIFVFALLGIGVYSELTEEPFTQVKGTTYTSEPMTTYDRDRARRKEYWKDKVYPTTPYNWCGTIEYEGSPKHKYRHSNGKTQQGNPTDPFQNIDLTDPYLLDRVEDEIGK